MSKEDAVVLASRTLSILLIIWALGETSYLPEFIHSYLRYTSEGVAQTQYVQYMHHYYLLRVSFLLLRIAGYFLLARWFYKGGPGVFELLLPDALAGTTEGRVHSDGSQDVR